MSPQTVKVGTMDGPVVKDGKSIHWNARWPMKKNFKEMAPKWYKW